MSPVILEELQSAFVSVLYGAWVTVVYDLLRIFRRIVPHGNVLIGIEDFFFWIWTAFWSFSVLYRENDGSLRMYTIIAMGIGMILYHQTLSNLLVKILGDRLGRILKKIMLSIIMKLTGGKFRDKNETQKKL